jgi:hypothetical protein
MNRQFVAKLLFQVVGVGVLAIPLLIFAGLTWQRPPQTNVSKRLFQGITYRRKFQSQPRPIMVHVVKIDLTAPGIRLMVTPGKQESIESETDARTTSEFLQEFKLQLAVNASFFHPFREVSPWDYYPRSGDRVGAVGQAISNGVEYSFPLASWPVLCISSQQKAQILSSTRCPPGTTQAVAGSSLIVQNGKPIKVPMGAADSDGNYSRTAVAINRSGTQLWIIAVDDKQWFYSEGVTLAELAEMAIAEGADAALNLDGGGSTTLVAATKKGFQRLNSPVHTKIPMRERSVANHLGIYARPIPTATNYNER